MINIIEDQYKFIDQKFLNDNYRKEQILKYILQKEAEKYEYEPKTRAFAQSILMQVEKELNSSSEKESFIQKANNTFKDGWNNLFKLIRGYFSVPQPAFRNSSTFQNKTSSIPYDPMPIYFNDIHAVIICDRSISNSGDIDITVEIPRGSERVESIFLEHEDKGGEGRLVRGKFEIFFKEFSFGDYELTFMYDESKKEEIVSFKINESEIKK